MATFDGYYSSYRREEKPEIIDMSKYVNKYVQIKFIGGRSVTGIVRGYDTHLNIVLEGAVEYLRDPENCHQLSGKSRQFDMMICFVTGISSVNPVDGLEPIDNPFTELESD